MLSVFVHLVRVAYVSQSSVAVNRATVVVYCVLAVIIGFGLVSETDGRIPLTEGLPSVRPHVRTFSTAIRTGVPDGDGSSRRRP